jgi:hypothetical protein
MPMHLASDYIHPVNKLREVAGGVSESA